MKRWIPFVTVMLALFQGVSAGDSLIVYSGRGEALVGPLLEQFTRQTGIEVRATYQGTPALATQLLAEGRDTPADVILAQDAGYLAVLVKRDLLAPLPATLLEQVDPRFRDRGGRWIGTSGRARVLVYNPQQTDGGELPKRLADLADPRWRGRLGWAPGNASFQAHVSALRHLWGEQATREWLRAVQANQPVVYPKNSPQVQEVASGEIRVGWVNHYYLHKLRNQVGDRATNASLPTPGDAGNVLMPSGAAIVAATRKRESALTLLQFLVSEEAQRYFAQQTFEYPTRPGVPTHPDVPPLDSLNLADVAPEFLTDLEPTLVMLRELGLQ